MRVDFEIHEAREMADAADDQPDAWFEVTAIIPGVTAFNEPLHVGPRRGAASLMEAQELAVLGLFETLGRNG